MPHGNEREVMKRANARNALQDNNDEAARLLSSYEEKTPNGMVAPPIACCDAATAIHESAHDNKKISKKKIKSSNSKNKNSNKNDDKVKKEFQDEIETSNAEEKVEEPCKEKVMQEEMKIEKALESLSKVKIPRHEIAEKLCKIIENYYETICKSESSANEIDASPSCDANSNIKANDENCLHHDNSEWEDANSDSDRNHCIEF